MLIVTLLFSYRFIVRLFGDFHPESIWIFTPTDTFFIEGKTLKDHIGFPDTTTYTLKLDTICRQYKGAFLIYSYKSELFILNFVEEKDYLASVVGCELPDTCLEALKAQAVAARTYAYKNVKRHGLYDFCDGEHCQVYKGEDFVSQKSLKAVEETDGLILAYKGEIADIYYHSNCGGYTIKPQEVWENFEPKPYLVSVVDSIYSKDSPRYKWEISFDKPNFMKYLGVRKLDSLNIKKEGEVVKRVSIFGDPSFSLTSNEFQKRLAGRYLSPTFFIEEKRDSFILHLKGFGHRIGMCQWGAIGMAKEGAKYTEILSFYFPGTQISSIFRLKEK